MVKKGNGALLGGDAGQRNGFQPSRVAINEGQKIRVTTSGWEVANEVQMEGS